MTDDDWINPRAVLAPAIEGVHLNIEKLPGVDAVRISATVGPDVGMPADGKGIVIWWTTVDLSPAFISLGGTVIVDAIRRQIDAWRNLLNDATERGFQRGLAAGKKAARDELGAAARTLAEAFGLKA